MNIKITDEELSIYEALFKKMCDKSNDCSECKYKDSTDCKCKFFYESAYKNGYRAGIMSLVQKALGEF